MKRMVLAVVGAVAFFFLFTGCGAQGGIDPNAQEVQITETQKFQPPKQNGTSYNPVGLFSVMINGVPCVLAWTSHDGPGGLSCDWPSHIEPDVTP